jgi:hypothetical protein
MNAIILNFLLVNVLPSTLFLFLFALVAILGVARWLRTLLVLALVALALRILGVVILQALMRGDTLGLAFVSMPMVSNFMISVSISIATVATFLALVLASRGRSWGWFVAILLAAIIGALGANFAFSIYGLRVFFGTVSEVQQVSQIYLDPWYAVVANVIASLNILALLLYALFGPNETTNAAPAASMADDVTLP